MRVSLRARTTNDERNADAEGEGDAEGDAEGGDVPDADEVDSLYVDAGVARVEALRLAEDAHLLADDARY